MSSPQQIQHLNKLPTELIVQILNSLQTISSLKALTHASPLFHHVYHFEGRVKIFTQVLKNELGWEVFKEAYLLIRAEKIKRDLEWPQNTTEFLKFMSVKGKSREKDGLEIEPNDLIHISKLVLALHEASMIFFKKTIGQHPLTGEPIPPSSLSAKLPSTSELRRIEWAILRVDIFCKLCTSVAYNDTYGEASVDGLSSNLRGKKPSEFFCQYKPWEADECLCICAWYYREYDSLYKKYPEETKDLLIYQGWKDGIPGNAWEGAEAGLKSPCQFIVLMCNFWFMENKLINRVKDFDFWQRFKIRRREKRRWI